MTTMMSTTTIRYCTENKRSKKDIRRQHISPVTAADTATMCSNIYTTAAGLLLLLVASLNHDHVNAFSATTVSPKSATSPKSKSPIFEHLKFDGNPQFDVLQKAKEYTDAQTFGKLDEAWYDEDYVLRGPVIGPINRADLAKSQKGLGIQAAFPDLTIETFGHSIDPENPYRCFYFQRWRGTNSGNLDNYGTVYPATNQEMETPVAVFSVVFNPNGKIVYEHVGSVVDRHEGNTQGKAAVFGMLHTAGLKLSANPGDKVFAFIQRAGHIAGNLGRSWSKPKEIPKWWTSKSKGADETDQI